MLLGYLVEFKKRDNLFSLWGDMEKALCSKKYSYDLFTDPNYLVFSARLVDIQQYQLNHEEQLQVFE